MDELASLDASPAGDEATPLSEGDGRGDDAGGGGAVEVQAAPFDAEPAAPEVAPWPPDGYRVEQLDGAEDPTVRIYGPGGWSTPSLPLSAAELVLREHIGG